MLRHAAVAVACAHALVCAAAASAADVVCAPPGEPRGTILYFHPGGFIEGAATDPGNVAICRELAARGYRTRAVDYPLFDLPGAVRAAQAAAARADRPAYAVGDSAGGTFAALLAVQGRVDGAATFGAVTDLLAWPRDRSEWAKHHATREQRIAASPARQPGDAARPLLVMHDPGDEVVPFRHARLLARRAAGARIVRVRAQYARHTWRPSQRRRIVDWIDALRRDG
jgi:acetyl esterase/lipase